MYDEFFNGLSRREQDQETAAARKLAQAYEAFRAALADVAEKAISDDLVYTVKTAINELEDGEISGFLRDAAEAGAINEPHVTILGEKIYY